MALPVMIETADGSSNSLTVTADKAALVSAVPYPPDTPQLTRPVGGYLANSGSSDMGVDGSLGPVDFSLQAANDTDRYITGLSFVLGYGASATLFQFADGVALPNGIRIFYSDQQGENELTPVIKSNLDLLRTRRDPLPIDWQVRNFLAVNDYGYVGFIDLTSILPPFGVKLDKGSRQALTVSIRDDLSAVADVFNFYAQGFERFTI